jgi:hypothetical protein
VIPSKLPAFIAKYLTAMIAPVILSVGHCMVKLKRWPELQDVPFMVGYALMSAVALRAHRPVVDSLNKTILGKLGTGTGTQGTMGIPATTQATATSPSSTDAGRSI